MKQMSESKGVADKLKFIETDKNATIQDYNPAFTINQGNQQMFTFR